MAHHAERKMTTSSDDDDDDQFKKNGQSPAAGKKVVNYLSIGSGMRVMEADHDSPGFRWTGS